MSEINVNDILSDIFVNKNTKKYNIRKYNNKTEIFNDKVSILIYYLNYYIYSNYNYNIENIINNIELDIGSYCYCDDKHDITFWFNLKKCIIIVPNEIIKDFDINETNFIIYKKKKSHPQG